MEMRFGWDYIVGRKGLLFLLLFFLSTNFLNGVMQPLFVPLILDNWNASVLGYLSTIMGLGMLAGTLVMSAWGGGKAKIYTLLGKHCLLIFPGRSWTARFDPAPGRVWFRLHVFGAINKRLQPGHLAGQSCS